VSRLTLLISSSEIRKASADKDGSEVYFDWSPDRGRGRLRRSRERGIVSFVFVDPWKSGFVSPLSNQVSFAHCTPSSGDKFFFFSSPTDNPIPPKLLIASPNSTIDLSRDSMSGETRFERDDNEEVEDDEANEMF
jgi:hypothetical protein